MARSQRVLLFVQAGLVIVLVSGAALLLHSFERMNSVDPGYETRRVAWLRVEVAGGDRAITATDAVEAVPLAALLDRARSVPGVLQASAVRTLPGAGPAFMQAARTTPDQTIDMGVMAVSGVVDGTYFETLGIPFLRGETFMAGATPVSPSPAVIDELLARRLFGETDPVGRTFYGDEGARSTELVVVGVMPATRQLILSDPGPQFLRPLIATAGSSFYLVARTRGRPEVVLPALRDVVGTRGITVTGTGTLRGSLAGALVPARLRLSLMGGFAGLALGLALLDIYGVVSHHVMSTRRDIGIRVALGASGRGEARRVVLSALGPTALGVAAGLASALALSRLLESVLYDLPSTDPVAYLSAGALVLSVALVSSWIPARGVTRVHPIDVLRDE